MVAFALFKEKRRGPRLAKKIGAKIRQLRLKKRLSQGDLAKKSLVIDRAYISRLERGQVNPTLRTLERLAALLDVSLKDFL